MIPTEGYHLLCTRLCTHNREREREIDRGGESLSVDFIAQVVRTFSPADPGEEKEGDSQKNVDESDPYQSMMAKKEQEIKFQPLLLAVTNRSDAMVCTMLSELFVCLPPLPSHLTNVRPFSYSISHLER
jgi:hypothetical protein